MGGASFAGFTGAVAPWEASAVARNYLAAAAVPALEDNVWGRERSGMLN